MRWTSPLRRSIAAIFAVWFVLVMVEPVGVHSCPVHGGHGSATPATAADAGHADASHAGHDGAPSAPGDSHAGCTCPGDCTAAGAGTPVPSAEITVHEQVASVVRRWIPAHVAHAPSRARFVLPFANGPPRSPRSV